MLVPVHAFAKRMLARSGEEAELRRRHVRHVIDWLTANARVIESDDPLPGLEALERASANVRAAHQWCTDMGDPNAAAEIVTAFSMHAFRDVTAIPELRSWVDSALSVAQLPASTRLQVLIAAATFLDEPQNQAIQQAHDALQLAHDLNDHRSTVLATVALANAISESDGPSAIAMLKGVVPPLSSGSDSGIGPVVEAYVLNSLCSCLLRARRHGEVEALLGERLAFGSRRFGLYEAALLYQSGRLSRQLGDFITAERRYLATDRAARRAGSVSGRAYALFGRAQVAFDQDDLEPALRMFEEGLKLDQLVDPHETWADRVNIGIIACRLGETELAGRQLEALGSSGRPIVQWSRALVAGCLAALNGAPHVAEREFALSAQLATAMGSSTHLANVYVEWARYTRDEALAESLRGLSAELRSGSLAASEADSALRSRD
jgi:tetratricopeptide (TPR) repeat protein